MIARGLRLRWLGSELLTWRDLFVLLRHLPEDSALHRVVGVVPVPVQLAALTVDGINARVWQSSKDGERGTNRPKSLFDQLIKATPSAKTPTQAEVDDFDRWYAARFNSQNN